MKQQPNRLRRLAPMFLLIGVIFFAMGWITGNTTFTWIAIPFLLVSFFAGSRWQRRR